MTVRRNYRKKRSATFLIRSVYKTLLYSANMSNEYLSGLKSFFGKFFKQYIFDAIPEEDVVDRQQFVVFRIYTFAAIAVSLGVFFKMLFTLKHVGFLTYLIPCLSLAILINFFRVTKVIQLRGAYVTMLIASCLLLHFVSYSCGGIQTAGSFYFPAIILYSYLLLGRKGGMIITALILLHIIYLFIISTYTNWISFEMFSDNTNLINEDFLTNILMTFVLVAVISNYLQSNKNVLVQRITKSKNELEKVNKELLDSNRFLEKKNAELNKFASVAAHDLRSPLRAIGTLCDMVIEDAESLGNENEDRLNIIKSRVERIDKLLSALRNYSKADQGNYKETEVKTGLLIAETLKKLQIPKNFRVYIRTPMPWLFTARQPLQQILNEVLSNAVKFNDSLNPEITISCKEEADCYRFSVKDNGPGIAPEFHEKIFIIFQTLNARDTFESTGAGLAIAKKIAEENCGAIGVNSSIGEGAEFWFIWKAKTVSRSNVEFSEVADTIVIDDRSMRKAG